MLGALDQRGNERVTQDKIKANFKVNWPGFSLAVDLVIPGRGVTALFGQSGSGKTTLLRCIAGLERAEQGFLSFKGEIWQNGNFWLPPHKRPLGYVFQEASLFPHLTVLGNLHYGRKRISEAQQTSLDPVIELFGIGHLLDRKPDRLSGGERQRVGIARALAVNPRILLMDEPLAALDLARKQEILPYLEQLRDQFDIPIIYVSHSPDEVARLADYIVALDGGAIVAEGVLTDLLSRLDFPVRLGEDAGVVLEAEVIERDERWHLARVGFPGGSLWTRDKGIPVGRKVRVRVLARDISVSNDDRDRSSILNVLPGQVDTIADDEHPGLALVRVKLGSTILIARVTKRSAFSLGLTQGQPVWLQIKSVALLE